MRFAAPIVVPDIEEAPVEPGIGNRETPQLFGSASGIDEAELLADSGALVPDADGDGVSVGLAVGAEVADGEP